jgi:hypothetical protein
MSTQANPLLPSLMPGANPTGVNIAVPSGPGGSSTYNHFLSPSPITPQLGSSPFSMGTQAAQTPGAGAVPSGSAAGTPYVPSGATANLISAGIAPSAGAGWTGSLQDLVKGFEASGMTRQMASLLGQFLMGGAGYNPQVANALIAQMQPSIERGQENLLEQFSAGGNRFGSGAQIGLGDYLANTNLDIGSVLSNLYEQSVQNYMNALMNAPSQNLTPTNWDLAAGALDMATQIPGLVSGLRGMFGSQSPVVPNVPNI